MEGAPSFRVLCERVGGSDLKFHTFQCKTYRSEVPTLAKDARWGAPSVMMIIRKLQVRYLPSHLRP